MTQVHEAEKDQVRKRMEYRVLGRTDLEVSVLGFGASPLGDVFRKTDPLEGCLAVHRAIDDGINFFDVSPYYGLTLAEERLGQPLMAGARKSYLRQNAAGMGWMTSTSLLVGSPKAWTNR